MDNDPGGTIVIGKSPLATASLVVGTDVHGGLVSLTGSKDGAGTGERAGVLAHWAHNVALLVPNKVKCHEKKGSGWNKTRQSHDGSPTSSASSGSFFSFIEAVVRRKGCFT